jgi:phosphatidylethanolamine/phosphatidyl-N-methylethanolamine N-methyltransferase
MTGEPHMANRKSSAPSASYASDALHFFRAWMAAPLRTGAQLPSGRELAKAMAAAVDPAAPGVVVELGAGTGAITAALVARGIAPERLILIEADPQFCALLKQRYPAARVLSGDAYAAPRMLRELSIGPIAAIVSGLPLLTQKPVKRQRLLLGLLRLGVPGSAFVQFTYFYRSPIPIGTRNIASDASPIVWWNLWPARVFTYRRQATAIH